MHPERVVRLGACGAALTIIVAFAGALVAVACSGSDQPPSTSFSGDGGGPVEGGSLIDSTPPPDPDLCTGLELGGQEQNEVEKLGPLPEFLGGTLAEGTYDLDQLLLFDGATSFGDGGDESPGSRLTGQSAKVTALVTKDKLRIIDSYGATGAVPAAGMVRAYTWVAAGTKLHASLACPTSAPATDLGFTAVTASGFSLEVDAKHVQVYRRRP